MQEEKTYLGMTFLIVDKLDCRDCIRFALRGKEQSKVSSRNVRPIQRRKAVRGRGPSKTQYVKEMNVMSKKWWRAAGIRALKTVCQTLASTLPVGFVVTPVMIQQLDWSVVYVVLAWLGTAALNGIVSMLTSLAGLPEVDNDRDSDAGLPVS